MNPEEPRWAARPAAGTSGEPCRSTGPSPEPGPAAGGERCPGPPVTAAGVRPPHAAAPKQEAPGKEHTHAHTHTAPPRQNGRETEANRAQHSGPRLRDRGALLTCAARRGGRPRGRGAAAGGEGREGRRREKNPNSSSNNNKKKLCFFLSGTQGKRHFLVR